VTGVFARCLPERLRQDGLTETVLVDTLEERKAMMIRLADAAIALPDFIRNEAGLKGRAILKGVLRQIKIWNPEKIAGGEC
jgi:hypothetical protein